MTLYPSIARQSLRPIEEMAERESVAPSLGILRALVRGSEGCNEVIVSLWEREKESVKNGVEGSVFRESLETFLDCLMIVKRLTLKIDEQAAEKGDEALDVRTDAQEVVAETDRHLKELTRLKEWMDRTDTPERRATAFAKAERVINDPNTKWVSDDFMDQVLAGEEVLETPCHSRSVSPTNRRQH